MKIEFLAAASALALVTLPLPAYAQHQHMPGMDMPMPKKAPAKNAPAKKATAKGKPKTLKAKPQPSHQHAAPVAATPPSPVQPEPMPMDHSQMDHGAMPMGTPEAARPMDHSSMPPGEVNGGEHTGHGSMLSALGPYPMSRDSSGTAWQPDTSEHTGLMTQSGDWMLMAHGVLNLVYDHQSARRGDDKAFASGMLMGMAQRPLGDGTLQFKAMVSPDPIMGRRGYPLLLASGETANGTDRLIDRQHPHDFFMELSASASQNIGPKSSVFIYAGLPGEPAFGPPAFMHREAILDSPEAPISHHWLDSTHITFGVLTGGLVLDRFKAEVSRFNAREPDQHRWNIETGPLDSTSVRLSWNPTRELALQGSWGHFEDPEQLEPGVNQKRWSASALYAREIAPGWKLAGTLAWGRKTIEHHKDDAYVAEASLKHDAWTIFGRGEITENREILDTEEHGPASTVGKVSLGAVRDFRLAEHLSIGAGGLFAVNFVPDSLASLYGGNNPVGAMAFLRLKFD
ncbi:hypothetical protein LZ016_00420 [Sphingomonas sp. SM33]|uniref:Uncharacterized protein n=1 Tax=Sphingomonas telluris TaxID=2907998 RepID=A0ABS9VHX9_9SPHN|nr:hypothetical protein [Sphingomonas telluris]MCH8614571.1 hypothetical protein [Sphingomonas telluris]